MSMPMPLDPQAMRLATEDARNLAAAVSSGAVVFDPAHSQALIRSIEDVLHDLATVRSALTAMEAPKLGSCPDAASVINWDSERAREASELIDRFYRALQELSDKIAASSRNYGLSDTNAEHGVNQVRF